MAKVFYQGALSGDVYPDPTGFYRPYLPLKITFEDIDKHPMKSLLRLTIALVFCLTCAFGIGQGLAQASPLQQIQSLMPSLVATDTTVDFRNAADDKRQEAGNKIDLNNAPVRAFISLRGMYPTLAAKIVNNSPYRSVDEVFNIPDLSDRQKDTLSQYIDLFTVTDPSAALNYGFDRINNGIYK